MIRIVDIQDSERSLILRKVFPFLGMDYEVISFESQKLKPLNYVAVESFDAHGMELLCLSAYPGISDENVL